jgi:hypothetical protein
LYSSMISSLINQTKVSLSIQSRKNCALGTGGRAPDCLKAAIPATSTDVSTTPLGRFFWG